MGVEALAGSSTDVVTTHWRGYSTPRDDTEVTFPREDVGKLGGTTRSYIGKTGGGITLQGDATFEQLCYIFNSGIKHVDPTTDASSAQIRTWAVQNVSTDPISTTDLDTLVFEDGDNQQAEIARYGFCTEINLTGTEGGALEVSAPYTTRARATTTFTSISDTDLDNACETILFSNSYLYIDAASGSIGSTQKSDTLLDMSLKFTTGWKAQGTAGSGRKDFSFIKRVADEIMLEVTFEHNATTVTEIAAWRNETERALRLKFTGSALSDTDAGAPYDTKALVIDLYGKWQSFSGPEGQDGDNVCKGTFKVAYCATANAKASFVIANEMSVLP